MTPTEARHVEDGHRTTEIFGVALGSLRPTAPRVETRQALQYTPEEQRRLLVGKTPEEQNMRFVRTELEAVSKTRQHGERRANKQSDQTSCHLRTLETVPPSRTDTRCATIVLRKAITSSPAECPPKSLVAQAPIYNHRREVPPGSEIKALNSIEHCGGVEMRQMSSDSSAMHQRTPAGSEKDLPVRAPMTSLPLGQPPRATGGTRDGNATPASGILEISLSVSWQQREELPFRDRTQQAKLEPCQVRIAPAVGDRHLTLWKCTLKHQACSSNVLDGRSKSAKAKEEMGGELVK
ncbi:unnamed protein product [Pleuronectes platessa]|uniref:Uncharacterized protein n=1 Tax=Pleuronectes platessa TaxID=8262 RepID=A0A9N7U470_PLEPL|nr:unnamed protein product [Pleuronectes platessa]